MCDRCVWILRQPNVESLGVLGSTTYTGVFFRGREAPCYLDTFFVSQRSGISANRYLEGQARVANHALKRSSVPEARLHRRLKSDRVAISCKNLRVDMKRLLLSWVTMSTCIAYALLTVCI